MTDYNPSPDGETGPATERRDAIRLTPWETVAIALIVNVLMVAVVLLVLA